MSDRQSSSSSSAKESSGPPTASTFFRKLRDKVVEPFTSINQQQSGKHLPGSIIRTRSKEDVKPVATVAVERKQLPLKLQQFAQILSEEDIDLVALKKLSWNGIPAQYRPMVWQLLLGYVPTNKSRRDAIIARKRKDYRDSVATYFTSLEGESGLGDRTSHEGETMRQIKVDLPRTSPDTPFFQQPPIQRIMERILYIWSIRHPASSYVQGINDLLTPVLLVCMSAFVPDALRCDVIALESSEDILQSVEADAYWCLTKLLDYMQDHYTSSQPGLQRMVMRLEDLVHRVDNELHTHISQEGVLFMQFAFRWMNCLLLRELPLACILRLWDTYLSEERSGFEHFHVYVCTVLLIKYKAPILRMDFTEMLTFLQDLPTGTWNEESVEPILSQAFVYSTLFEDSPSHLR